MFAGSQQVESKCMSPRRFHKEEKTQKQKAESMLSNREEGICDKMTVCGYIVLITKKLKLTAISSGQTYPQLVSLWLTLCVCSLRFFWLYCSCLFSDSVLTLVPQSLYLSVLSCHFCIYLLSLLVADSLYLLISKCEHSHFRTPVHS